MNAILEAARLQGQASISRKAWVTKGGTKVHLWELSIRGRHPPEALAGRRFFPADKAGGANGDGC